MMDDTEIKAIATAWNQLQFDGKPEDDANFLAFAKLYDLCVEAPEDAWRITQEIIALNGGSGADSQHISQLAAGPIESLLVYHGDVFIEKFEQLAKEHGLFRTILGGVWQNRMKDEVWTRIQAIAGPRW